MRMLGSWLVLLLAGCDAVYSGFLGPNPRSCMVSGCEQGQVCNVATLLCDDPCGVEMRPPDPANGVRAVCVHGMPPAIDGDLSDWQGAQWTTLSHGTADYVTGMWNMDEKENDHDALAQFALRWDGENLYTAARITDDKTAVFPSEADVFLEDSIEFYYDGEHDQTTAYGDDDHQFVFGPPADARVREYKNGNPQAAPPSVVWMSRPLDDTTGSWTLEVKIPWSLLGKKRVEPGRVLGFDIELNDHDEPGGMAYQRYTFVWKRSMTTCDCAGSSVCHPYCSTKAFGRVQLVGRNSAANLL